jgi:hypothetical protein
MATPHTRKSLQNDLAFVERQLAQRKDDPHDTLQLMWQQRKDALIEELANAKAEAEEERRAQVALIFEGNPVLGSAMIRLDFTTKALEGYQGFVSSLMAEKMGTELGMRGKLPGAFSSRLFVQDMLRGSVGFLLEEPQSGQYPLIGTALREVVEEGTRILRDLAEAEETIFARRVTDLAPRTLQSLQKFTKVLHDAGAETQIVGNETQFTLDHNVTALLNSRLLELEIVERPERREGVLRGLFPERQQYEFRPSDGSPVFYGPVSETLVSRYITDASYAHSILLRPVTAFFNVISTFRAGKVQSEQWVLEDIRTGVLPQGALSGLPSS